MFFNPTQYLTLGTKEKRPHNANTMNNSNLSITPSSMTPPSSSVGLLNVSVNHSPSFSSSSRTSDDESKSTPSEQAPIPTPVPAPTLTTSPPEKPDDSVIESKNSAASCKSHSLLLTSSPSTSSLCSSSKLDEATNNHDDEASNSRRMSSSSQNSSYISSDSLNVAHDVEWLLNDMVERVATVDELKALYERLSQCDQLDDYGLRDHLRMIRCIMKRRLGVNCAEDEPDSSEDVDLVPNVDNKKNKDAEDNTSLTVMLDDVLQYFDFLNAEMSELGDGDDDDSEESDAEEAVENRLTSEKKSSQTTSTIKPVETYDLNRLLNVHLSRIWVILDELEFISKQSSPNDEAQNSQLSLFKANLTGRLTQEIDCFRRLGSQLDDTFDRAESSTSDTVEELFFQKSLLSNEIDSGQTNVKTKLDIWQKSLNPNSLFTADVKQLSREFTEHRGENLAYFFNKMATSFAETIDNVKYLSIFHYGHVFDCLNQIDLSDLTTGMFYCINVVLVKYSNVYAINIFIHSVLYMFNTFSLIYVVIPTLLNFI